MLQCHQDLEAQSPLPMPLPIAHFLVPQMRHELLLARVADSVQELILFGAVFALAWTARRFWQRDRRPPPLNHDVRPQAERVAAWYDACVDAASGAARCCVSQPAFRRDEVCWKVRSASVKAPLNKP